MKKKLCRNLAALLLLAFTISISVGAVSATNFEDVNTSNWYYDSVEYVVSAGLFSGTSATTFSPDTAMSRGMFVTVIGRLAEVPDSYGRTQSTPFGDVTQADYFFPYAVWANDNGIVTGVGANKFNPNGEISREQMATILFRYAEKFGYDLTYSTDAYHTFSDAGNTSSYAATAMQWATTHNIMKGSDGKLVPQDTASRAQVAQIFLNFSQLNPSEPTESEEPNEPEKPSEIPDWENYNPVYDIPTGKSDVDADGGYFDYDLANEIMAQVNTLREEHGVKALLYNPKIQEWAGIRAQEQIEREGHTRPDGTVYSTVGKGLSFENIIVWWGCTESELSDVSTSAEQAVNDWYTSPKGHKEAMLSSSSSLGAIACYVKNDSVYIVHLFSNNTLYFIDYLT